MRVAITESVIAEQRRAGGAARELWDATVRGLALRIQPSGRASWFVRTWTAAGKRTSIKLGEHPALKVADGWHDGERKADALTGYTRPVRLNLGMKFDPFAIPSPGDSAAVEAYCRMRSVVTEMPRIMAALAALEGVWRHRPADGAEVMWRDDRRFVVRQTGEMFAVTEEPVGEPVIAIGTYGTLDEATAAASTDQDHGATKIAHAWSLNG